MDLAYTGVKHQKALIRVSTPKHQMRLYVCHQMRLLSLQRSNIQMDPKWTKNGPKMDPRVDTRVSASGLDTRISEDHPHNYNCNYNIIIFLIIISKGEAPKSGAPKGGARRVGAPKISRFFSFSRHNFILSSLSWGVFSWNFGGV